MLLATPTPAGKVLRLYTGWVDYAARKAEPVVKTAKVYRGETKVYVEKTSATLAALLKAETPEAPVTIFRASIGKKMPLAAYVKIRNERKAAKIAKAAEKAAAIEAEKAAEAALIEQTKLGCGVTVTVVKAGN